MRLFPFPHVPTQPHDAKRTQAARLGDVGRTLTEWLTVHRSPRRRTAGNRRRCRVAAGGIVEIRAGHGIVIRGLVPLVKSVFYSEHFTLTTLRDRIS